MMQTNAMCPDQVSYVTSHDRRAGIVHPLGRTFVDGGVHTRFGKHSFTMSLENCHYIEIACLFDRPVTKQSPWSKAVCETARECGCWLTWIFTTKHISKGQEKFGGNTVDNHRTHTEGSDHKWRQIGVNKITKSYELTFFIQWLTTDLRTQYGRAVDATEMFSDIDINYLQAISELLGLDVECVYQSVNDGECGILAAPLVSPLSVVR